MGIANKNRILEPFGDVVETRLWDKATNALFCFYKSYSTEQNTQEWYVLGYVFIEISPNNYKRYLIDHFEMHDGNDFQIESVFFANADKDATEELAILFRRDFGQSEMGDGWHYDTRIYDHPDKNNASDILQKVTGFEEVFSGLEGRIDDGPQQKAKFKTAADVKRKLKEMGF